MKSALFSLALMAGILSSCATNDIYIPRVETIDNKGNVRVVIPEEIRK